MFKKERVLQILLVFSFMSVSLISHAERNCSDSGFIIESVFSYSSKFGVTSELKGYVNVSEGLPFGDYTVKEWCVGNPDHSRDDSMLVVSSSTGKSAYVPYKALYIYRKSRMKKRRSFTVSEIMVATDLTQEEIENVENMLYDRADEACRQVTLKRPSFKKNKIKSRRKIYLNGTGLKIQLSTRCNF